MSTSGNRERIGLFTILLATFIGQVDGFVVTIAIPTIQADLHSSFGAVQAVGAAYVLAMASGLVVGARIGDRYGRRRVFLVGCALFGAASVACGIAPSIPVLIVARLIQGLGAALFVPQELALIRELSDDERHRARALAAYGVATGAGVVAGIVGGGLLLSADVAGWGWRTLFLVNIPVVAVILVFGPMTIARSLPSPGDDVDVVAAIAVFAGTAGLLTPVLASSSDISGRTLLWILIPVALAVLEWTRRRQRRWFRSGRVPMLPPDVLALTVVRRRVPAIAVFFAGNAGLFLVYSFVTQEYLGRSPAFAGLLLAPVGLGFAVGSTLSARCPRLPSPPVACGCAAIALLAQAGVIHSQSAASVVLPASMAVIGLAQGVVIPPVMASLVAAVTPARAGAVSGVAATSLQIGLATGYAAVGALYRAISSIGQTDGSVPLATTTTAAAYSVSAIAVGALLATAGLMMGGAHPPQTTPPAPGQPDVPPPLPADAR